MTFTADIRAKWDTFIWEDASILEPVLQGELQSSGLIEADVDNIYFGGRINFFQCVTKSTELIGVTGLVFRKAIVTVSYYKALEVNEDTYNTVVDRLEHIRDLVATELGINWDGAIDSYQLQQAEPDVVDVLFDSTRVWRAREQYIGDYTDSR